MAEAKPASTRSNPTPVCYICCDEDPEIGPVRVGDFCGCRSLAVHVHPCLEQLANHPSKLHLPLEERLTCQVCHQRYKLEYTLHEDCQEAAETPSAPESSSARGRPRTASRRQLSTVRRRWSVVIVVTIMAALLLAAFFWSTPTSTPTMTQGAASVLLLVVVAVLCVRASLQAWFDSRERRRGGTPRTSGSGGPGEWSSAPARDVRIQFAETSGRGAEAHAAPDKVVDEAPGRGGDARASAPAGHSVERRESSASHGGQSVTDVASTASGSQPPNT